MTILYILLAIIALLAIGIYFGEKLAEKDELEDNFEARKLDGDFIENNKKIK